MGQVELVRALAVEQRKRLVASLMEYAERNLYPSMTGDARRAYRDKVLASVGVYHDMMLDVLRASMSDDVLVNEEALGLLRSIHSGQQRMSRSLEG